MAGFVIAGCHCKCLIHFLMRNFLARHLLFPRKLYHMSRWQPSNDRIQIFAVNPLCRLKCRGLHVFHNSPPHQNSSLLQPTPNTSRRKAREAYLIHRGQTLEPIRWTSEMNVDCLPLLVSVLYAFIFICSLIYHYSYYFKFQVSSLLRRSWEKIQNRMYHCSQLAIAIRGEQWLDTK